MNFTENKSYMNYRRNLRLSMLPLVILGMVIFLLPGCGSDSKPGGKAEAKKEKAAKPNAALPYVMEGKASGDAGTAIKKQPARNAVELPGLSREELEKRNAEALKISESPGFQIMPGLTREEMERRNAEALKIAESPGFEPIPGVTREEMAKRNAEALKIAPPWFADEMAKQAKQAAAQPPAKPQHPAEAER